MRSSTAASWLRYIPSPSGDAWIGAGCSKLQPSPAHLSDTHRRGAKKGRERGTTVALLESTISDALRV